MRVLVTGGAGYIGSHTAKALALAGHDPVVFDDLSMGHRWAVRWGPLIEGDLADGILVRRALGEQRIDAVVHFAASTYVGESIRDPGKYFRNNVRNTCTLLDAMVDVGIDRIVFSSTCATYGTPDVVPITEDTPQRPINPYGESKLFVERALHWYGEAHGLRSVALRYFNAAGADPQAEIGEDHSPETHLVPALIEAALRQRPCADVYGTDYPTADGTAERDYVHVSDLADAHRGALAYLADGGVSTALNLGTGRAHSVRAVRAAVEEVSGRQVPVQEQARRPGDPPTLVADALRASVVLGWQPRYRNLSEIVETAWRWHLGRAAGGVRVAAPAWLRSGVAVRPSIGRAPLGASPS